jgi:hypothetical protein
VRTPRDLIDYKVALTETGISKRALLERITAEGVTVWIDGRDRRRRLLDRRDLPKLMATRPDERRAENAA